MRLATSELPAVVTEYITEVVLPKATTPTQQFAVGFLTPFAGRQVSAMTQTNSALLKTLGVLGEDDTVDLELAKSAAQDALVKAGGSLMIGGFYRADAADLDALVAIASRHATQ